MSCLLLYYTGRSDGLIWFGWGCDVNCILLTVCQLPWFLQDQDGILTTIFLVYGLWLTVGTVTDLLSPCTTPVVAAGEQDRRMIEEPSTVQYLV